MAGSVEGGSRAGSAQASSRIRVGLGGLGLGGSFQARSRFRVGGSHTRWPQLPQTGLSGTSPAYPAEPSPTEPKLVKTPSLSYAPKKNRTHYGGHQGRTNGLPPVQHN